MRNTILANTVWQELAEKSATGTLTLADIDEAGLELNGINYLDFAIGLTKDKLQLVDHRQGVIERRELFLKNHLISKAIAAAQSIKAQACV